MSAIRRALRLRGWRDRRRRQPPHSCPPQSCRACAEEVAQLHAMGSALRAAPSMPESDTWRDDWRARVDGKDWWARWHVYRIAGIAAAVILFIGSITVVLYADRAAPIPSSVQRVQANGVVYEVSTDKVRYAWGEPVFVQVKVSSLDMRRVTPLASESPGWWVQVDRDGTPTWDSRRHLTLAQRDLVATLEPGRSRGVSSAWDQEDDARSARTRRSVRGCCQNGPLARGAGEDRYRGATRHEVSCVSSLLPFGRVPLVLLATCSARL